MALSQHVAVNTPELAQLDLAKNVFDNDYYKFKLDLIMQSLPLGLQPRGWWKEFTGLDIDRTYNMGLGRVVEETRKQKKTICHIAHFNNQLEDCLTRYPGTKVIKLLNFKKFNSLAFEMKSPDDDLERHQQGFDYWVEHAPKCDITVDIDGIMYDPNIFESELRKLYDFFELDDVRMELLTQFRQAYLSLHQIN